MEEVLQAIEAADWPRALALAIEAWRALRVAPLADLIDALDARCPALQPKTPVVDWWRACAEASDHVTRGALLRCGLASSTERWQALRERYPRAPLVGALDRGPAPYSLDQLEIVERLVHVLAWDDPRAATLLASWFVDGIVRWSNETALELVYRAIAERLIGLGDPRVVPAIASLLDAPFGPRHAVRALQRGLAAEITTRLAATPPSDGQLAAIAACAAAVPAAPLASDPREDALWSAIAEAPHELEHRSVLGDFLVERGDSRGELIALQLADSPRARIRVKRLLATYWKQWLGDLALVVTKHGTEFERGMLSAIRVGMHSTPGWAYASVRGHRELATVRAVRAHYVAPELFARLVDDLPREPETLGIDSPETVEALRAYRETWTTREVEYRQSGMFRPHRNWPPYAGTLSTIAATFPHCTHLRLGEVWSVRNEDALAAIGNLTTAMPQLERITVELHQYGFDRVGAQFARLPRVEVVVLP